MQRAWAKADEIYDDDVRKDRVKKSCALQFYGAFMYEYKGPCYIYAREITEEKRAAVAALAEENAARKHAALSA